MGQAQRGKLHSYAYFVYFYFLYLHVRRHTMKLPRKAALACLGLKTLALDAAAAFPKAVCSCAKHCLQTDKMRARAAFAAALAGCLAACAIAGWAASLAAGLPKPFFTWKQSSPEALLQIQLASGAPVFAPEQLQTGRAFDEQLDLALEQSQRRSDEISRRYNDNSRSASQYREASWRILSLNNDLALERLRLQAKASKAMLAQALAPGAAEAFAGISPALPASNPKARQSIEENEKRIAELDRQANRYDRLAAQDIQASQAEAELRAKIFAAKSAPSATEGWLAMYAQGAMAAAGSLFAAGPAPAPAAALQIGDIAKKRFSESFARQAIAYFFLAPACLACLIGAAFLVGSGIKALGKKCAATVIQAGLEAEGEHLAQAEKAALSGLQAPQTPNSRSKAPSL